jgi:hypothetical protein
VPLRKPPLETAVANRFWTLVAYQRPADLYAGNGRLPFLSPAEVAVTEADPKKHLVKI